MAKPFKGTINVDIRDKDRQERDHTAGILSIYHGDRKVGEARIKPYHDLEREAALMLMRE